MGDELLENKLKSYRHAAKLAIEFLENIPVAYRRDVNPERDNEHDHVLFSLRAALEEPVIPIADEGRF